MEPHENKKWYSSAKYGINIMFSCEDSDRNPLSGCCSDKCRIFPDGRIPKNINEIANVFDVKCFAAFCRDIGVEYVNFPLCHEHIYTLCRNPALDKRIPGHSSGRDVIRELLDELHRYGIKLQLYVHVTAGDTMTDAGREATGYNDPTGGCKKRNNFANEVLAELIGRYGSDMDSYYFDTISDDPILNMTDIACLRKTVSDRAPDVILTGNGEANDLVGFSSRENCAICVPKELQRYSNAVQQVVLVPAAEEHGWRSAFPSDHSAAGCTPESLYRILALNIGSNTCGGGVAYGFGLYCDGGFDPEAEEAMRAVGKMVQRVSESIKNTVPSKSFVTPSGIKTEDLAGGFTAVTSADGKYEYLHVLIPPQEDRLVLPESLDGRRFKNALLLPDGKPLECCRKGKETVIVNRYGWDSTDTVIRMETVKSTKKFRTGRILLPAESLEIHSDCSDPNHPAECMTDGDNGSYWQSIPGCLHEFRIGLDREYCVRGIKMLPRQDPGADVLKMHIAIYSVYVSTDGEKWRAVATGEWKKSTELKKCSFPPVKAKYLKVVCGPDWSVGSEHKVDSASAVYVEASV